MEGSNGTLKVVIRFQICIFDILNTAIDSLYKVMNLL